MYMHIHIHTHIHTHTHTHTYIIVWFYFLHDILTSPTRTAFSVAHNRLEGHCAPHQLPVQPAHGPGMVFAHRLRDAHHLLLLLLFRWFTINFRPVPLSDLHEHSTPPSPCFCPTSSLTSQRATPAPFPMLVLLIYRDRHDDHSCSLKYGGDWETYKVRLPPSGAVKPRLLCIINLPKFYYVFLTTILPSSPRCSTPLAGQGFRTAYYRMFTRAWLIENIRPETNHIITRKQEFAHGTSASKIFSVFIAFLQLPGPGAGFTPDV